MNSPSGLGGAGPYRALFELFVGLFQIHGCMGPGPLALNAHGFDLVYIYIYIYISEVGGGSLAHPTGKSFRFVRACVRAVLVKSFRNEKVHGAPCIFYL